MHMVLEGVVIKSSLCSLSQTILLTVFRLLVYQNCGNSYPRIGLPRGLEIAIVTCYPIQLQGGLNIDILYIYYIYTGCHPIYLRTGNRAQDSGINPTENLYTY